MTTLLIYVALGLFPGYIYALQWYKDYMKKYNPSSYEYRYQWISKSIKSIMYGIAFIISVLLWPIVLVELLVNKIKEKSHGRD